MIQGLIFAKISSKPLYDILEALRYQVDAQRVGGTYRCEL